MAEWCETRYVLQTKELGADGRNVLAAVYDDLQKLLAHQGFTIDDSGVAYISNSVIFDRYDVWPRLMSESMAFLGDVRYEDGKLSFVCSNNFSDFSITDLLASHYGTQFKVNSLSRYGAHGEEHSPVQDEFLTTDYHGFRPGEVITEGVVMSDIRSFDMRRFNDELYMDVLNMDADLMKVSRQVESDVCGFSRRLRSFSYLDSEGHTGLKYVFNDDNRLSAVVQGQDGVVTDKDRHIFRRLSYCSRMEKNSDGLTPVRQLMNAYFKSFGNPESNRAFEFNVELTYRWINSFRMAPGDKAEIGRWHEEFRRKVEEGTDNGRWFRLVDGSVRQCECDSRIDMWGDIEPGETAPVRLSDHEALEMRARKLIDDYGKNGEFSTLAYFKEGDWILDRFSLDAEGKVQFIFGKKETQESMVYHSGEFNTLEVRALHENISDNYDAISYRNLCDLMNRRADIPGFDGGPTYVRNSDSSVKADGQVNHHQEKEHGKGIKM